MGLIDKIKDKFIHICRKLCGYYELEKNYSYFEKRLWTEQDKNKDLINKLNIEIIRYEESNFERSILNKKVENLESQLESKILEQDIVEAKLESKILEYDIINARCNEIWNVELPMAQYKFLIYELESILGIMKNKGTHPQDLLLRTINEAKRQLGKLEK